MDYDYPRMDSFDSAGNPLNISMDNKECYDDILPIYKMKPENPRDRESEMIRELNHIEPEQVTLTIHRQRMFRNFMICGMVSAYLVIER